MEDKLKQNARIDAIFFLWCPTYSRRFEFDDILQNLKTFLGDEAINSVIFVINQVSHLWNQDYNDISYEFQELLAQNGLKNPVFSCDIKQMTAKHIEELKGLTKCVKPYREEEFKARRMKVYAEKLLAAQKRDDEKKIEQEMIENEASIKFHKSIYEMEEVKTNQEAEQTSEQFLMSFDGIDQRLQKQQSEIDDLKLQIRQQREIYQKETQERVAKEIKNLEDVQRTIQEWLKKELEKKETENNEKNRRLHLQYEAKIAILQEQNRQLEIRFEKEKAKREAEEMKRKEEYEEKEEII